MNKTKLPISDKEKIREQVHHNVSQLSAEEKEHAAREVCEKLWKLPRIQKSIHIIIYEALEDEVNLKYFFQNSHKHPGNIITITPSGNYTHLPKEGVILVPGRAFTLSGKRVGRGGGWYDKLLQKHPQFYKIGVSYNCQIFDDLPQDTWDIILDTVIYSSIQSRQ